MAKKIDSNEPMNEPAKQLPVIIIGGGGHAKVLADCLLLSSARILGVADPKYADKSLKPFYGLEGIGDDQDISKWRPDEVELVNGIGSLPGSDLRLNIFLRFKRFDFKFATVIHPSAIVGREVLLGEGAQLMAGAIIQTGTKIGDNCIVNTRVCVDHDCQIGAHSHLAPGATICGGVRLGEQVHVGAGASIGNHLSVGKDSVIGAGASVVRDLLEATTVLPATVRNNKAAE